MPEIRENFYENILFKFESCSCDCVEDIEHITPGMEPKRTFKLQAHPEQKRIFGYAAKKGLVRISDNGSIEQSNILGELIALPGKDSKELARFMKDNGFIFPISSMGYQEIDELSLYNIIDRLRLTVELMTAANEIHKNYLKILQLTAVLLFAKDFSYGADMTDIKYISCHHSYVDLLQNPPIMLSPMRKQEEFDGDFFTINDSILGTYSLNISEYNDIIGGYSSVPGFKSDIFKNITAMYVNGEDTGMNRKITEVLFHFFHEVAAIDLSSLTFCTDPRIENLSDNLKAGLIEIADYIVGEEINANLWGIHPVYNAKTMSPSWKVDSLLCAAYFSIFYLRPDLELYRPCDNPRCGKYFLVRTTSTKVRYCSTECCNRVTQDRYRKRKREKEEN